MLEDGRYRNEAAVRYLEVADISTQVELAWPLLQDPARTVRLEAQRLLAVEGEMSSVVIGQDAAGVIAT